MSHLILELRDAISVEGVRAIEAAFSIQWDRGYAAAVQDATNELHRLAHDTECFVTLSDVLAVVEALGGEL